MEVNQSHEDCEPHRQPYGESHWTIIHHARFVQHLNDVITGEWFIISTRSGPICLRCELIHNLRSGCLRRLHWKRLDCSRKRRVSHVKFRFRWLVQKAVLFIEPSRMNLTFLTPQRRQPLNTKTGKKRHIDRNYIGSDAMNHLLTIKCRAVNIAIVKRENIFILSAWKWSWQLTYENTTIFHNSGQHCN